MQILEFKADLLFKEKRYISMSFTVPLRQIREAKLTGFEIPVKGHCIYCLC